MGDLLMNDIQISENKEELTLTTIDIADMMEMPHWQILRKLDGTKKIKGIIQIRRQQNCCYRLFYTVYILI